MNDSTHAFRGAETKSSRRTETHDPMSDRTVLEIEGDEGDSVLIGRDAALPPQPEAAGSRSFSTDEEGHPAPPPTAVSSPAAAGGVGASKPLPLTPGARARSQQRNAQAIAQAVAKREAAAIAAEQRAEQERESQDDPFGHMNAEERGRQAADMCRRGDFSSSAFEMDDVALGDLANPDVVRQRVSEAPDYRGRPIDPSLLPPPEKGRRRGGRRLQEEDSADEEDRGGGRGEGRDDDEEQRPELPPGLMESLMAEGDGEEEEDDRRHHHRSRGHDEEDRYDDEEPPHVDIPLSPEEAARLAQEHRDQLLHEIDMLQELHKVDFGKRFNHTSSIPEMESVISRHKKNQQAKSGIKVARLALLAVVGAIEWGNNTFDPIGAKLDGWSVEVEANMEEFDDILWRVWERYMSKVGEMNPLLELIFALAMSGIAYHSTQKKIEEEVEKAKKEMRNEAFKKDVEAEVDRRMKQMEALMSRRYEERLRERVDGERERDRRREEDAARVGSDGERRAPPPIYTNPRRVPRDDYIEEQKLAQFEDRKRERREQARKVTAPAAGPPPGLMSMLLGGARPQPPAPAAPPKGPTRRLGLTIPNLLPKADDAGSSRTVAATVEVPLATDVELPSPTSAAGHDGEDAVELPVEPGPTAGVTRRRGKRPAQPVVVEVAA